MDDELEALLRSGGRLDSSGSFTLDASRARVKLGRFHLPPGRWVLSLIQAGVAAGCERIELHCKSLLLGSGTRVVYRAPAPRAFNLDALMKGLAEPLSLAAGSPEAYLTEGILASGSSPAWLRVGRTGREVLREREDEIECWRSGEAGPERAELQLEAELPAGTVRRLAQYAPVPILVGGERLRPHWHSPLEGVVFHLAVQFHGDGAHPLHLPPPRPCMVRVGHAGPTVAWPAEEGVFLDQRVGSQAWDSGIVLPARRTGPAILDWVRHGVVVTTEELDLGWPGARVVACAHGLETDLTRYQLVRNQAYHERVQELTRRVGLLLEELRSQRAALRVPDQSFQAADTAVTCMAGSFTGLLGLAALGVTSWPVSVVAACLVSPLAGYLAFRKMRDGLQRRATEQVLGWLESGT